MDPVTLGMAKADARRSYAAALARSDAGLRALRIAPNRPGYNPIPTITLSTTLSASTPTQVLGSTGGASGDPFTSPNTAAFTFLGGTNVKASAVFPGYTGVRKLAPPSFPSGFGGSIVEFVSDAPALSVNQTLGELGVVRILCDDVEIYRCGPAIRLGTAQAGAAQTITLDAGASATNGLYYTRFLRITGGLGVGQLRQITGYVGATKVATVSAPWVTQPDATSTFEIAVGRRDNNTSSGNGFTLLDWGGERRLRKYRIENPGATFYGVYVTAVDTVHPAEPSTGTPTVWCGDSFSAGTFSDGGSLDGMAAICCDALGWSLINASIGGTGYLAPLPGAGSTSLNAYDRLLPPLNAWLVRVSGATAGTFTLTQSGVTTAGISYAASQAVIKAAMDAAFGANAFDVAGDNAGTSYLIARTSPAIAATLTGDFSGLTVSGGQRYIGRYTGEVTQAVPQDGAGNALPFNIVLANGHNDTLSSNAAYTTAALTAQVTRLLTDLGVRFPTGRIFVVGNMYMPGGSMPAEVTNANAAILAACTAALPKVNGFLPFIDTLTPPWSTGTGWVGALAGNGNSDVNLDTDGVHPTPHGQKVYGRRTAARILAMMLRNEL